MTISVSSRCEPTDIGDMWTVRAHYMKYAGTSLDLPEICRNMAIISTALDNLVILLDSW